MIKVGKEKSVRAVGLRAEATWPRFEGRERELEVLERRQRALLPHQLEGPGSAVSSPSGFSGGVPPEIEFHAF